MGRRIILHDGTVIEDGEVGYSQGLLWVWLTGHTLQEAALMFLDQTKTSVIVYQYGEMQDEYEGYTNCTTLQIDVDGKIAVCLMKG